MSSFDIDQTYAQICESMNYGPLRCQCRQLTTISICRRSMDSRGLVELEGVTMRACILDSLWVKRLIGKVNIEKGAREWRDKGCSRMRRNLIPSN
jgi:hypothetical protein